MTTVGTPELDALVRRERRDPHDVLGAHPVDEGVAIRVFRPAACAITAQLEDGTEVELQQIHPGGVFEAVVEDAELPLRYRLEVDYGSAGKFTIDDPYGFLPTIGELDQHLIGEGRHEELYDKLGAHVIEHQGVLGTAFAVWAPAARAVSVVGDFNMWDGRLHAMRSLGSTGVWELFLPGVEPGARYKYEILDAEGELRLKADPYAQQAEHPPQTASIVFRSEHRWGDSDWLVRDWFPRLLAAGGRRFAIVLPPAVRSTELRRAASHAWRAASTGRGAHGESVRKRCKARGWVAVSTSVRFSTLRRSVCWTSSARRYWALRR